MFYPMLLMPTTSTTLCVFSCQTHGQPLLSKLPPLKMIEPGKLNYSLLVRKPLRPCISFVPDGLQYENPGGQSASQTNISRGHYVPDLASLSCAVKTD